MALFEKNKKAFSYEVEREGEETIVIINCEDYTRLPSIEDDAITMGKACDILIEVGNPTKIVFNQKRNYEYEYSQTLLLLELAKLYNQLSKRKDLLNIPTFSANTNFDRCIPGWFANLQNIISNLLRSDPIGAYVELKRLIRDEKIRLEKTIDEQCVNCSRQYVEVLEKVATMLEKTRLITLAQSYLPGYKVGDRSIYRRFFVPTIKPDFMFTKLMSSYPLDAEEMDSYKVGDDTEVTIFEMPESILYQYHMMPPEFQLTEEKYEILDTARKIMSEHKPQRSEFINPERMRQVFTNIGTDLIGELVSSRKMKLSEKEIEELAKILVRYTVGFGLIELLLQDEKIQDITINSPMGESPMFIVHADYGDCQTNIIPSRTEAESWASKLRLISGRPLDEANPVLDTELTLPGAKTRIAVISEPLNPTGLAYAFRRHRDKPWTLPLFIKNRMITPLAAGLLSFIIDGSRTLLVAGTRSAGKTSVLSSLMVEIMRKYRIITIEDTLELPGPALRKLGYNIQGMKVASAMTKGTSEVPADEGIRTTLRLGDSALIVGEVRSTEAKALYEAMRVGALANVVAGTIHADSPYGVFDRVVNDLEVPRTSFKATDIIVVANPIRSADGLHRWRRVTQISEVRKQWEHDPLLENGFSDLMKYDANTDQLEPSSDLINGDSDILKAIAGNVKDWAGNWDAVWENIQLRAKIKETIMELSEKANMPDLLEAPFVIRANDEFHRISDKVKEEVGNLDPKKIFFEWHEWAKRHIKKKNVT